MKVRYIAFATVMTIFTSHTAQGKKVPAPAPNIAASAKVDISTTYETLPGSVPMGDISLKFVVSHSFSLSAQQEAALLENTTITFMENFAVTPGDDPNFQNGDKSFKVTKLVSIEHPVSDIPMSISAKWGNGKFTIIGNAKYKAKGLQVPNPIQELAKAISGYENLNITKYTIGTRSENIMPIVTAIEHGSISPYIVTANMAADTEMSVSAKQSATGVMTQALSQKSQSRFFGTLVE